MAAASFARRCGSQRIAFPTRAQHAGRRNVLDGQATTGRHLFGPLNHLECGHGGMHHVDRVVTAQRLGQDVVHPGALQHRAAGATGDHTGTRAGRTQHHNTGRGLALHGVNDGATDQRNAEEVLACFLHTLGDRRGDFLGLAVADTDHALAVADDDQRGEAEPAATLDHLGDAVDRDDPLQVVALVAAVAATTATTVAAVVAPAPAAAVVAAAALHVGTGAG